MSSEQSPLGGQGADERLVNLDLLRNIAALMVCLSHAPFFLVSAGAGTSSGTASWLAIPALGVGVDLFFAISGFVVALSLDDLQRRCFDVGRAACAFYLRRLGRIVPLAWTVLLVIAGVFVVMPRAVRDMALPWADLISAATFTANGHFGRCFAGGSGCGSANLLHHTWSLAIELQFYAVAPLLFLLPIRALRVLTFGVLFIGIFFLRPWQTSLGWAFRIEALLLGFWIGREWVTRAGWCWQRHVPPLQWIELISILVVMALLPRIMTGPLSGLAIVGVAALTGWIVVRSALSPALVTNALGSRVGQSLWASSYAIYLIHPPIMIGIGWSGAPELIGFWPALALSMMIVIFVARWLTRTIGDPVYRAAQAFTDRHLLKERSA
ncbi:MAG: acyltransferase family protein [Bosea sp. (in: a-proteobacteria)]